MYWSAAFWMMGRTVVEPLILMVWGWPDEAGAAVVAAGVANVPVDAGVAAGAPMVEDVAGACVATGFVVPLSVQPVNSIAEMSNAARLMVTRM
jgi:hypothetical protein